VTRARPFASLEFTARLGKSFQRLTAESKSQCAAALEQLVRAPLPRGLQLKPIQPSKEFWEARINRAERLILLPVGNVAYVIDVVSHDDIKKWSR